MFLSDYDEKLQKLNTKSTLAAWNYYTNLTDENEKINNEASLEVYLGIRYYLHFISIVIILSDSVL